VGGMLIGTIVLLFLVPALFIIFQHLQEKIKPINMDFHPDWAVQADIEENEKRKKEKKKQKKD
jgi:HAE1 family hydrophobic/amphiphilic exporter-1